MLVPELDGASQLVRTFRVVEDGDVVLLDEHHLFNARYGVHIQPLERAL